MEFPTPATKTNCDASTDDPKQALLVDLATLVDKFNALLAAAAAAGPLSGSGITGAAPLASPAFTGSPTAPTLSSTDNSNGLASTAHVKSVAVDLTSAQTIAGNKTFSSAVVIPVGTAPNHAVSLYQSVYIGQTRQDVTASRVLGTTYTNTGSKPITVLFWTTGMAANAQCNLLVNGLLMQTVYIGNSLASMQFCVQGVVLPGETYSIATGVPKTKWYEIS